MPKLILASKSPRRHMLLKGLDVDFEIKTMEVDESYPESLEREHVALHIAHAKADAFAADIGTDEVVITADTIVCLEGQVIEKPTDRHDAVNMLKQLSGKRHDVITAVVLVSSTKRESFYSETAVYFKPLTDQEIEYYIDKYEPYDKAGSYGIQEWIGYMGIEKIEGCFFNVMGLPLKPLYEALNRF